jgi:Fe2+ transport system protein B
VVLAVFRHLNRCSLMDGVHAASSLVGRPDRVTSAGSCSALLIEGVWGGVGAVLFFPAAVLLLFLFIGVLKAPAT